MGTFESAGSAARPVAPVRWLFSDFLLDGATLELSRDGVVLPLERKPLEVLLCLLQHSGEVVTKDELLAQVWPGRILSETTQTKAVSRLREVLGDHKQALIKTVHGFGYRFTGTITTEAVTRDVAPIVTELKVGDNPPMRPHWRLESRIGGGGMGDAWLVRHDKTAEVRVFKFASDPGRLAALKREITLYRLIRTTLEDEAPIVTLLDWNLEQAPYFIESRHAKGGSLSDWWQCNHGSSNIDLPQRVGIVAGIADALAAIHSIGILHKDLKPSNVLVELAEDGSLDHLVLGDLGSGTMSDPARVEALGITRMGFTRTLLNAGSNSGTLMYLAPELQMGQPPTIQADIYALGVMLYQLVIGDLSRPLAPGWEREVQDEILRQDIAAAVDGNPARRTSNAAEIAKNLRLIDRRRDDRAAQLADRLKADKLERSLERMQARRTGLMLAVIALSVGLVVSGALFYRARLATEEASKSADRARLVSDFLMRDVLAPVDTGKTPVKDLTIEALLTSVSETIDRSLPGQDEIAMDVSRALGRGFAELQLADKSCQAYEKAAALATKLYGAGSEVLLGITAEVIERKYATGHLADAIEGYRRVLADGRARLGESDAAVGVLRLKLAWTIAFEGHMAAAAEAFREILLDPRLQYSLDARTRGEAEAALGRMLYDIGDYKQAKDYLDAGLARLATLVHGETDPGKWDVSIARQIWSASSDVGLLAVEAHDFDRATVQLQLALDIADHLDEPWSDSHLTVLTYRGRMQIERRQYDDAIATLTDVLRSSTLAPKGLDQMGPTQRLLALAYQRKAQAIPSLDVAERTRLSDLALNNMLQALHRQISADGEDRYLVRYIRVLLADLYRERHDLANAADQLDKVRVTGFSDMASSNQYMANFLRVDGLVHADAGDLKQARTQLQAALDQYRHLYGSTDDRTLSIQSQLLAL